MKAQVLYILALPVLLAAAPSTSSYTDVPQKKSTIKDPMVPAKIREEAVRPEEVYKYGVQEFALIANDTGYFPSRIIVRRNIPVHIFLTSSSARNLCFVMDDFSIRKAMAPQSLEEIRFLPTKAGQYKFYCPVQEIQGSLIVRD